MAEKNQGCTCSDAPTLIFPCSGAADVGEISDRAARKLTCNGVGKMFCLAGLGGHVNNILMSTQAAGKILVIDGCPVDCAKKTLEHAGLSEYVHLRVTDIGIIKGKSPVNEKHISQVYERGKTLIGEKRCCS